MRSIVLPFFRFSVLALLIGLTCSRCAWAGKGKLLYRFPYGRDGAGLVAPLILDSAGNLYGTAPSGGTHGAGIVFKLAPTGSGEWTSSVLYTFAGGEDGGTPQAGLVLDAAGNLYGTTACGGDLRGNSPACTRGSGTVFELAPSGGVWTESVLYRFTGGSDGAYPVARLVFDSLGNLYGTTENGGNVGGSCYTAGCGVVFELTPGPSGSRTQTVLHAFANDGLEGIGPQAGLVLDQSGNLYGTTSGSSQYQSGGTVFELTPGAGGWSATILYNLPLRNFCCFPGPELTIDATGSLYLATLTGGSADLGTILQLSPGPGGVWTPSTLYSFIGGNDGEYPVGGLVFDPAGNLYGTTFLGGGKGCPTFGGGCGTIFELSPHMGGWQETVLYRFTGGADGCCLEAGLARDASGNLFGVTEGGGRGNAGIAFELTPSGGKWTGTLLHIFHFALHGAFPYGSLVSDSLGNLYGTTYSGGEHSFGTVFEVDTAGNETVLYTFSGGGDGEGPIAGLVFDKSGNLYGTTLYGGSKTACHGSGCGTVFELSPQPGGGWKEYVIHAFTDEDGNYPSSGLTLDPKGNLYGATPSGGSLGGGVVFQLTPGQDGLWTENILYTFSGGYCNGPASPNGDLVFDRGGDLYGTTSAGSALPDYCAGGTVFRLTPSQGGLWTISYPYNFCSIDGCPDGRMPQAGVILDAAGDIYGTTVSGGTSDCWCGTVFKIELGKGETVLYSFTGGDDGVSPIARLAIGPGGKLYGTTESGGGRGQCAYPGQGCGTIFELTPSPSGNWSEKVVHRFTGPDGGNPASGVLIDSSNGGLYGTTWFGGVGEENGYGLGVLYELTR